MPPTTGPAGGYFGQALVVDAISGAAVTLPLPEAARLPRRRATLSRDLASATGCLDAGTEVTVTLYA